MTQPEAITFEPGLIARGINYVRNSAILNYMLPSAVAIAGVGVANAYAAEGADAVTPDHPGVSAEPFNHEAAGQTDRAERRFGSIEQAGRYHCTHDGSGESAAAEVNFDFVGAQGIHSTLTGHIMNMGTAGELRAVKFTPQSENWHHKLILKLKDGQPLPQDATTVHITLKPGYSPTSQDRGVGPCPD